MFEHWDWAARASLYRANLQGRQGSPELTPEHIAFGVLVEPSAHMDAIAARMGIDLEQLKAAFREEFPPPTPAAATELLSLAEASKRVLAHAAVEAERLAHGGVGAMHILLGICAEGTTRAAAILAAHGVTHAALLPHVPCVTRFGAHFSRWSKRWKR